MNSLLIVIIIYTQFLKYKVMITYRVALCYHLFDDLYDFLIKLSKLKFNF